MPRRPPPTALRLVEGPLPGRGRSKFTLPSLPRPIFHPPAVVARGPVPRARQQPDRRSPSPPGLPPLAIQQHARYESMQSIIGDVSTSPSSASPTSGKQVRGPWDHSRSISVPFNVEAVLAAPKPAAVNSEAVRFV